MTEAVEEKKEETVGAQEVVEEEEDSGEENKELDQEEDQEGEQEPVTFTVGEKSYADASALTQDMSAIIHTKYALGSYLTGFDKELALALLEHHPDAAAKKGSGVSEIAVTLHPAFHNKCLMVVRTDGTTEDFSVFKCIDIVFNKSRGDFKAHRVLIPKAVIRFDMCLTRPTTTETSGEQQSNNSEVRNAVRDSLTEGLSKLDGGAMPPATLDIDLSFDGTRKMQLVLMHSEERARTAAEKLPGECAAGICANIEKVCGWHATIDRVAVAEGAEEKMYWERRIAEKERHRKSARGGRGGAHRRGGGAGGRGGMKRNQSSSRGGKTRGYDRKPDTSRTPETTEPSTTASKVPSAAGAQPQQYSAVQTKKDIMAVTNGVTDLACRPTAGQTWRQTTSVGTAGHPPMIASSRKRPRLTPK